MRLDKEVLFDFIPKFLRDGWQVVSDVPFQCAPNITAHDVTERSCYW